MAPNTPEPRKGAAFGSFKKDDGSEGYVLFGGRGDSSWFRDTWELSLNPFSWQKVSETQGEVGNVVGGFIQQLKSTSKDRILLVGGVDEQNEGDNPTWQRDRSLDVWNPITHEDKIESYDSTPDNLDWLGIAKVGDSHPTVNYSLTLPLALAWNAGSEHPLRYYHPNSNKWRYVSRTDNLEMVSAFGSYAWLEWPEDSLPCRLYVLGGFDKTGAPLKLFQRVDLDFQSDQPPPSPASAELIYYLNHTILADSTSPLFTVDSSTPLFEGDPLVADGIGNIRIGNNSDLRIGVSSNFATGSTSNQVFPLQAGVWDDELGWIDRSDLETHIILPFSSFAQVRLIELYIIKSTGDIKVRIPLEDFGPHPELPQDREDFSVTGTGIDSQNRAEGLALFGGAMNGIIQNDLWTISIEDEGTQNQRFVWNRLN